ncbi:MAG: transketolase family protein [Clostridia bacterium]|nr:transketolase family protein [Clostridia bacterium]
MISTREAYGKALAELGEKYKDVVVLDADLAEATKTIEFKKKFPDRFFDIGIAEQDLIGTAAGLSLAGKIPFASTFAVFATGRAYDQIRNAVAYSKLNVKIAATHAGITVGEDGASHQALEDLALMRAVPNMVVCSPSDGTQTRWLMEEAIKYKGPMYLRLTRPNTEEVYSSGTNFEIGKGIQHGEGTAATIFATGVTVSEALKAQKILHDGGIDIRVVDMHTIKPIDEELIIKCAKETEKLITIEDHNIIGGLGSAVCEVLCDKYPKQVTRMGINDEFGQSGKWNELMDYYKITAEHIIKNVI